MLYHYIKINLSRYQENICKSFNMYCSFKETERNDLLDYKEWQEWQLPIEDLVLLAVLGIKVWKYCYFIFYIIL